MTTKTVTPRTDTNKDRALSALLIRLHSYPFVDHPSVSRSSAFICGYQLRGLVRHVDHHLEDRLPQRLALGVDAEVGAAAAVEDVGEDEVQRAEVRQLVAHDLAHTHRREELLDALGGEVL